MNYLLQRLLSAIPVLLGITIIVFFIISLIPGDPATAILGSYATPENVKLLNEQLGLDKGLVQRYFIWLGNLVQGDLGRSFALNRPVLDEILERFNNKIKDPRRAKKGRNVAKIIKEFLKINCSINQAANKLNLFFKKYKINLFGGYKFNRRG